MRAGLPGVRLHDLRHSFASFAAGGGGLSLPMIGKLLGHAQPATTARYAHLAHDPARAANEAIGLRPAYCRRDGWQQRGNHQFTTGRVMTNDKIVADNQLSWANTGFDVNPIVVLRRLTLA